MDDPLTNPNTWHPIDLTFNTTVNDDEHSYMISSNFRAKIESVKLSGHGYKLATVIHWDRPCFMESDLDKVVSHFSASDDVWTRHFLQVIVLCSKVSVDVNVEHNELIQISSLLVPEGPYVLRLETGDISAVSRLFPDKYSAFIGGSIKQVEMERRFSWIGYENVIAVPSRLYYCVTDDRPLAGLRSAVKDIIDIAGLETGCGNRCWREHYDKTIETAPCIQQLIDAGAILVGKTKTSQFAEGQDPTEWFDYICPFNPRGDTFQKPSSSSTGSAVAIAGYEWLDFAVGSDTGGSIRHPAGICGTYGSRPTIHSVSDRGVYSVVSRLDTVGIFARSASLLEVCSRNLMDPRFLVSNPPKSPTRFKLLYPVRDKTSRDEEPHRWFPVFEEAEEHDEIWRYFESTVRDLESHLNCTRTVLNIEELWRDSRPKGESASLNEATGSIYSVLTGFSNVRKSIDPFIESYKRQNGGRGPFIDPIVRRRKDWARHLTVAQHEAAVQSARMFSKWILDVLLTSSDAEEFPILVYPQSWGKPDYRDTCPVDGGRLLFSNFSTYSLSYLSGCPDYTVPLAEVPYHSSITDHEEWLPISLSILGRPGGDLDLYALLVRLESAGVLRPPAAGSRMYV